jgi:hypothetical protein
VYGLPADSLADRFNGLDADLDMTLRLHQPLTVLALVLLGTSLAGCASINERASAAMGDYIPQWAGGLPADAPPRPGTAKYDEWMKERERLRQMPADQRPQDPQAQAACATTKPFAFNSSSPPAKPAANGATTSTTCPTSNGSTSSALAPVH